MIEVESLDKFIRDQLVIQSELDASRVRNELSLYGTVLDESIGEDDDIFDSITPDVPLILFNVSPRSSENNLSETEENGELYSYLALNVHIIIYGDSAATMAQKLTARLRTQKTRSIFMQNEVYIEEVTGAEQIEEYKNAVMWIRDDFDLNIACKILIEPAVTDEEFLDYTKISSATETNTQFVTLYESTEEEIHIEPTTHSGGSDE